MTLRELLIGVALAAFILAALALAFAIRAVVRRARAGRRRMWVSLCAEPLDVVRRREQGGIHTPARRRGHFRIQWEPRARYGAANDGNAAGPALSS